LRPALPQAEQIWTTARMQWDFTVQGLALAMVIVVRKADGVRGTLQFTQAPPLYYSFEPECTATSPSTASGTRC
jgi:hypothetical protein